MSDLSQLIELFQSIFKNFLNEIRRTNIESILNLRTDLCEIYCNHTKCINIIEQNGRYRCNLKYVTIDKEGKCLLGIYKGD